MANTYVDYVGSDGTGTDGKEFAFSFPYIKTSHVVVEINQGPAGGTNKWERTTAFTVSTSPSTRVVLDSTPNSLWKIRVLRDSDANVSLVDFANGSVLTETELDNAYLHNRYLAEEAEEGVSGGTISKNDDGQFNADGLRLENLADPDSDDDAVNKGYADGRYVDVAGDTMTGNLDMGSNEVTSSAVPSGNNSLTNKSYVDGEVAAEASARITGDSEQVTRTGDSMSGDLTMTSPAKVVQAAAPTTANDLTNKTYVDGVVAAEASNRASGDATLTNSKVSKSGDTMTGALTLPAADPSSDNHATRKRYVDQQIAVAVSSGTPGGPIDTANISDGAITTDKLEGDAVTADKLDHTTVTPGSYTNTDITVDENGRITAASNGSSGAGATNLGQTLTNTSVEITSSTGDNTTIAGAVASGNAGVMTGADKNKLDGIATGATANSSDATLLNRANNTGTQTASTISDFDTEVANNTAVAANTAKVSNATHTGDVTGSTALTIANNAVTADKISDTDTQFLVDNTSTQKKVVVNDGTADVDFIVKSSGNGNLIITDGANNAVGIGTTANAGFALTSSNAAVGTSLVVYDTSSQTEGGQILINKAAVNIPSNTETDSYLFDTFKDGNNTYEHGTNADILRIVTPGTARNATAFADNGDISVTGDVFPTGDAQYDLGKSTLQWGTIYASAVNINGNTSFVSKYDSGWFNDTTGLANGGTYSFSHTLGTAAAQVQVYMATSNAGAGIKLTQLDARDGAGASSLDSGLQVTNITSSNIEVQLGGDGWIYYDSSGNRVGGNWGTTYTHIKVIAIG